MAAMKKKPHVLLVPYPAQGHVVPMLKLAQNLADDHGISITVLNLDFIHQKLVKFEHQGISLAEVPDEIEPSFGQADGAAKVTEIIENVLPIHLRKLLVDQKKKKKNKCSGDGEEISWMIGDVLLSSGAFQVARELGIKTAAFWTASAENLALLLRIPQLIQDRIIDENGTLINISRPISLSKDIPAWKPDEFPWSCQPDEFQRFVFKTYSRTPSQNSPFFDCLIVNSFDQLEPEAFQLFPKILPIGPLLTNSTNLPGSFWSPDRTCLAWLDKHPPKSVIYVAFGSIVFFPQQQFEELATGLEMTGRPFLWVVRTNFVEGSGQEFLDGFLERVANRGKIVEWTNQEEVLSHPSTGCFMSHCGWNSTLDGVWSGVPFLCWPYFADQFHNRDSICESWKVGLKVDVEDETGLITRSEIANKVEQLFNDETVKGNAIRLRETAIKSVNEGGSSYHNLLSFINNL
ncbi:UDP-glycosyltransferase 83A1 [Linum perenne]